MIKGGGVINGGGDFLETHGSSHSALEPSLIVCLSTREKICYFSKMASNVTTGEEPETDSEEEGEDLVTAQLSPRAESSKQSTNQTKPSEAQNSAKSHSSAKSGSKHGNYEISNSNIKTQNSNLKF